MPSKSQLEQTLTILFSEESSLKLLAELSQSDAFDFYNYADLTNLDLSHQDLSGLNFDKADLRGSNLFNVTFDSGAFNNAKIDTAFFRDDFDCYARDILSPIVKERIYVFCRFRPENIDEYVSESKITYRRLSEVSNLSLATIRKARQGGNVAITTAVDLLEALLATGKDAATKSTKLRQPLLACYKLLPNGGFSQVRRDDMLRLTEMADILDKRRFPAGRPSYLWREGPDTIDWLARYYSRGEVLPVFVPTPEQSPPLL